MINQFGIDVNTLDKFIQRNAKLVETQGYKLERADLQAGQGYVLFVPANFEVTIFVEEGEVKIDDQIVAQKQIITLAPSLKAKISANTDSILYLFFGLPSEKSYNQKFLPTDIREKYWGDIQTIVSNNNYAAKRIFKKRGAWASLEFHVKKTESYFTHSGKLLLRLRAGRAEDKYFELSARDTATIPPGLMHQRGGIEETVIFEISTRDHDSDSYLVEDGQKQSMPQLKII